VAPVPPVLSTLHLWKNWLGRFTRRSSHGTGAALAFGVFTAQLTLLSAAATTLAVEAAGHCLLFRVDAHLWGIDGMVVVIAAGRNRVCILTAQLTLLTTAAVAFGLHATLDILFPGALQTIGTVDPIAGILGFGLAHVDPFGSGATRIESIGIFSAKLALLASTSPADVFHAR